MPGALLLAAGVVVVGFMVFAAGPPLAVGLGWYTPEIIAARFGVEKGWIQPRPHDCEFNSVPYGDKHCHYKADFEVNRAQSAVALYWDKVED